jgi:hypothetical protein
MHLDGDIILYDLLLMHLLEKFDTATFFLCKAVSCL